jgi:hypothetical protein
MKPPVPLFPPRPSVSFAPDPKLQRAVDVAHAELQLRHAGTIPFALAIIDLGVDLGGGGGTLGWGAHKPHEVDYVASIAKVAALLAAFGLRDLVRRFHAAAPPSPHALFATLRAALDPEIDATAPAPLRAVEREHRIPHYEQVFDAQISSRGATASSGPDFTAGFREALELMIVPSDNQAAGHVIRGVGYGYLNGLLAQLGLFAPETQAGIWLAGDFVSQYPYVRIASVNDAGVAQAGTALAMAEMTALIVNRACLDPAACDAMRDLLARTAKGRDRPFVSGEDVDAALRIPLGAVSHAKRGFGPLKAGGNVRSEIFRLAGLKAPGKAYAVAYQNLPDGPGVADVCFMIRRALEIYE